MSAWDAPQLQGQCCPTFTVPGPMSLPGWLIRDLLDASKWSPNLDVLREYLGLPTYEPSFHGDGT